MSQFYFGTCETVFGIEIFQTERFILFCTCLFLIGFVSEFVSFVKLCFGKILVKPGEKKRHMHKDKEDYAKKGSDISTTKLKVSNSPLSSSSQNKSSYNSFEMTPASQSDTISVNSSKSLVSASDESSASASSDADMPRTQNSAVLASYSTHLDIIKFHPTDLVTNLELIDKLSRINRSTYTRFDFMMQNLLKLIEIIIGYGIMLLLMTFNFWFLFSLILGYTFGYFVIYGDLFNVNYFLISKMLLIYDTVKNLR